MYWRCITFCWYMKTVMTSKRPEKDRERLKVWILLDSWANYAERAELIELVCEIGLLLAVVMLFRGLGPSKKWYLFTTLSQTEYCHFLAVTSLYRRSQKQYDNRSCWWDGAFDFIYASWLSFWKGVCCSHAIYAISFWFLPWQDVCPPVCLSVCLSHAGVLSKQLYISSNFLHHRIAPPFEFFYTKRYGNILTVTS